MAGKRIEPKYYIDKNTDCHIIYSHKPDSWGYPRICFDYKTIKLSRYFYEKETGQKIGSLFVLHRCDNPMCVNVKHLFLGNQKDNVKDMCNKNRHFRPRGELHPGHKLTLNDRNNILDELKKGIMIKDLIKKYNVCRHTIANIKHKRSWNF